jgi:hypothetical protein
MYQYPRGIFRAPAGVYRDFVFKRLPPPHSLQMPSCSEKAPPQSAHVQLLQSLFKNAETPFFPAATLF